MAVLGEVLAGVDLDLEAQGLGGLVLRREAVDEADPAFPEIAAGSAEPRVEHGAHRVERVADRPRRHLHEVDVLRIARGRTEVELVQGRSAAKREPAADPLEVEDLHQRAADDEILLHLMVGDPRGLGAPRGDVVPGDHGATSTLALRASLQRRALGAPFIGLARTSGASVGVCS